MLKLVIAYDGTGFHGFARQPGLRTIEGVLGEGLARLLGDPPRLSVAGRTDAGVHAQGQVVSFEADAEPAEVQGALNGMLAPEVVVWDVREAPAEFDARHSARAREYRYRIRTADLPNPFTARYEWHRPGEYRVGEMQLAARFLEGQHDFTSFSRAGPADPVRKLALVAIRPGRDVLEFRVEAPSFLHQMVRSVVGTLVAVGEGRMEARAIPGVIEARSRQAAGPVAPPHGLTLVRVLYEDDMVGGVGSR